MMIDFASNKRAAKQQEDIDRRAQATRALDYYNNQQKPYLLDAIKALYPKEKDVMSNYAYTFPFTRNLINDMAIAFQETAEIIPDTDNQNILDTWADVVSKSKLHATLLLTDRMVELFGKVGVSPRWHTDKKYIVLDIITPDRTVVEQDPQDHTRAIAVRYISGETRNTAKGEVVTWTRWTDDVYQEVEINSGGEIVKVIREETNFYGEIPIAWFTNSLELDEFWHDMGYPIVETNEIVNLHMTNLRLAMDYQTNSLLVTVGLPESQSIPVGVTQRLNIPAHSLSGEAQNYRAEYITPSPALDTVWKLVNELMLAVAKQYGLSAQSVNRDASSFSSGYQLKLSKQDIVNRNKQKRELYRQSIKDLCRYMMACYTYYSPTFNFGDTAVKIDFADITFESNPLETAQLNAMELSNGTTSEVQIIMDRNPDLTEEEAIALYQKYKEHRQRIGAVNITRLQDELVNA